MNNNKGQALVLFILLIPIVIIILFMVVDIGRMVNTKSNLDNINYLAVNYGLNNLTDSEIKTKLEKLIYKNNNKIDIVSIDISDDNIKVVITCKFNLYLFKKTNILTIKSSYIGRIVNSKKIIERE